jgi:SprT protein
MNVYDIQQKTIISNELKLRLESKVLECLTKAQKEYGESKVTKIPEIRYDTTGKTAGWANWNNGNPYIRINPILFNENVEETINQTVPHEVAHIVVSEVWKDCQRMVRGYFGRRFRRAIAPHGHQWKSVMYTFGVRPDRCHNMDVTTVQKIRNTRHFLYKCNCQEHTVGLTLHRRALMGKKYKCKQCGSPIVYLGEKIK